MAVIRTLNMSSAIFAPGWTFETLPPGVKFMPREIDFWKKFWNYLYIHGPASLPFNTNFCQGITFNKESGDGLFNLGMQEYQPTGQSCSPDPLHDNSCISLFLEDGLVNNGACLKITSSSHQHSKIFHRVFVCDFASANTEKLKLMITLALKNVEIDPATKFRIYFVIEDKLGIEGQESVSMRTKPKGWRAQTQCDGLTVVGSVVDFTAATHTCIRVVNTCKDPRTQWHSVYCLVEVDAKASLTEVLLLPPPSGSALWAQFSVEDYSLCHDIII